VFVHQSVHLLGGSAPEQILELLLLFFRKIVSVKPADLLWVEGIQAQVDGILHTEDPLVPRLIEGLGEGVDVALGVRRQKFGGISLAAQKSSR
jgi:hypothetical protein